MRLAEFAQSDMKLLKVLETATGGATTSGSIASLPNAMGGVIKRMPSEPNLFGYVPPRPRRLRKKSKK